MSDVMVGFAKAAGWVPAAAAAGAVGAVGFGLGAYTGAKVQRRLTRSLVGGAMNLTGVGNHPVSPAAPEPMKTAGWPLVLGGAALLGAGAIAGAKLQRGLSRGAIMKGDAFKQQVRQKQLERQGTFAS